MMTGCSDEPSTLLPKFLAYDTDETKKMSLFLGTIFHTQMGWLANNGRRQGAVINVLGSGVVIPRMGSGSAPLSAYTRKTYDRGSRVTSRIRREVKPFKDVRLKAKMHNDVIFIDKPSPHLMRASQKESFHHGNRQKKTGMIVTPKSTCCESRYLTPASR